MAGIPVGFLTCHRYIHRKGLVKYRGYLLSFCITKSRVVGLNPGTAV